MKENRTELGFFFLKLDFLWSASTKIVTALNYLVGDLVVEFGDRSVVLLSSLPLFASHNHPLVAYGRALNRL